MLAAPLHMEEVASVSSISDLDDALHLLENDEDLGRALRDLDLYLHNEDIPFQPPPASPTASDQHMADLFAQVNALLDEENPLLRHPVVEPEIVDIDRWQLNEEQELIDQFPELYEIIDLDDLLQVDQPIPRQLPVVNDIILPSALNANELWLQTLTALENDDDDLLRFINTQMTGTRNHRNWINWVRARNPDFLRQPQNQPEPMEAPRPEPVEENDPADGASIDIYHCKAGQTLTIAPPSKVSLLAPATFLPRSIKRIARRGLHIKINIPSHRQPFIEQPTMHLCNNMLLACEKVGILSRISKPTAFYSQSFLVPKPDNSARLITNFKHITRYLPKPHCPLPNFARLLPYFIHHNHVMIKIDLKSAFYAIPIAKHSRYITATSALRNGPFFVYNRLPMGLRQSPAVLQLIMNALKAEFEKRNKTACQIWIYLDDMLLVGPANQIHTAKIIWLTILNEANLDINAAKSILKPVTQLEFLGIVINTAEMTIAVSRSFQNTVKQARKLCVLMPIDRLDNKVLQIAQGLIAFMANVLRLPFAISSVQHPICDFIWTFLEKNDFKMPLKQADIKTSPKLLAADATVESLAILNLYTGASIATRIQPTPILLAEIQAVIMAALYAPKFTVIVTDNMATRYLGNFRRTNTYAPVLLLQTILAFKRQTLLWVPSKSNPADFPSRFVLPKKL